jgi:serine protease Do
MNHESTPHRPIWSRALLIGGAAVMTLSLAAFTPLMHGKDKDAKNPPLNLNVSNTANLENGTKFPSLAPVVKKVAPSVVKVSIVEHAKLSQNNPMRGMRQQGQGQRGGMNGMPDLRKFFGGGDDGNMPEFNLPGMGDQGHQRMEGVGSGVIVTEDGYILTNNHVVDHADEIKVSLNDGRDMTGKVIGRDPKTDIALIKIEAHGLPTITIADSDKIEVGDMVLAIGNPFGIGQTVTTGIVSAKGRATMGLDYEDFIQTDAAINPGNSGGALVDVDGRLIGINTAILSRSGGNQGIGFAVPSNLARWVMTSLVDNGHIDRGFLGVNIQDVTPQLAKQFKLGDSKGALVSEVSPDSPAQKAGIKSGDVITEFNGKPVADSRHLKFAVGQVVPGTSVPVKLQRDGASQTLNVTLKELPGDKVASNDVKSDDTSDALHGVAVQDLDSATRQELNLPKHVQGAVISEVEENSAAYDAGLRKGDVITEINHKPVTTSGEAVAACEKPADKVTLVKVWSHGGSHYVVVDQSKVS